MTETGIVKWYNDAKGYGFITADLDRAELLVTKEDIIDAPPVVFELQPVEFSRRFSVGKPVTAMNVRSTVKEIKHYDIPRISVFENVLTPEYCQSVIDKHTRAGMNPNSGGQSRTESYAQVTELVEQRGISLGVDPYDYDALATAITRYARVPYSHIEAIDIYNYHEGQFLDLHHDYPYDPKQIHYYKYGGDRVGTGIFYFNDDFTGGETWFPKLDVEIKPKTGSFLYFEQGYDEETNWSTIHESKLITNGTKWIASCFFSDRPRVGYDPRNF
jgi:prolyl 4-hydroxylase